MPEPGAKAANVPLLQLHIEPDEPIEVEELTGALGALSRQYQDFATAEGLTGKAGNARLLVSNVSPGSIDINLLPDLTAVGGLDFPPGDGGFCKEPKHPRRTE